jgi:aspartyl/asparaginyl beta-hydroxylase (cupin superfamily)
MYPADLLIAFNKLFDISAGGSKRPVIFDIDKTYPQLRIFDRAFPAIRNEVLKLLTDKERIAAYRDIDQRRAFITADDRSGSSWKIFYLYAMGERPAANRIRSPLTSELLDQVPGVYQALFSILEAGKSIPAHEGRYRGYLRYHLALIVPDENPPYIRIKDEVHVWKEGQSILFDDSWNHEVINKATSDRVVLIVDVRRPMPFPLNLINIVVIKVIGLLYGKKTLEHYA